MYKFRTSKAERTEYAKKMAEIDDFVLKNNIHASLSNDSYYFSIKGKSYRVSNHTIAQSNAGAYNEHCEKIREEYHSPGEKDIQIFAGKTRLIEIYTALKNGKVLDGRGKIVGEEK